jgi:hypothetical protein
MDFDEKLEGGIISLAHLVEWFSVDMFRNRLEPDYISKLGDYAPGFITKLQEIGKKGEYSIP